MAIPALQITKNWFTGTVVQEPNWDNIRNPLVEWARNINLAFDQIASDAFGPGYTIDNDGAPNLVKSLQQQINEIILGAAPLQGTTFPTWTIHLTFPGQAVLSTSGLTGVRTFTFPDLTGEVLTTSAVQVINGIKLFQQDVLRVGGLGAGIAILRYQTSALSVTHTIPEKAAPDTFAMLSDLTAAVNAAVPVGTIIPFYDFNALVAFSPATWAYCDGSVIADAGSPINGQTLPDLSGRYLVGFGTDGGGDIDTAAWATAAVGNAGHTVNLQHSHTVNSHSHTVDSHNHSSGTLQFKVFRYINDIAAGVGVYPQKYQFYTSGGTATDILTTPTTAYGDAAGTVPVVTGAFAPSVGGALGVDYYTTGGAGNTGSTSPGTSAETPGTNNQLSTTQSIQPRSIRVRFIIRYK